MAQTGRGINSFVRMKKETAYATRATTGFWTIPLLSEGINTVIDEFRSQTILNQPAIDSSQGGPRHIEGPLNFQCTFNVMDQILHAIMGVGTDSTPSPTFVTTRDHWFELSVDQPSYTMEICRGNIEADNAVNPYYGMLCNSMEITIPERGFMTAATTWLGFDDQYATAATYGTMITASAVIAGDPFTPVYIMSHGPFSSTIVTSPAPDAGAYCIRSMSIKVDRKLQQNGCVGSLTLNQPQPDQLVEVTGTLQLELKDWNVYDQYLQFAEQTTNSFTWVGPLNGDAGSSRYTFQMKLNRMRFLAPSHATIDRRGKLLVNAPFICVGGGGTAANGTTNEVSTKEPISFRTRNIKAGTNW